MISTRTAQHQATFELLCTFVLSVTGRMGPAAFTFIKKVGDAAFADQPRERARWAFRWVSRINEIKVKGLATQLLGQTQHLREQVERKRKSAARAHA